ncbi:MAG: peroxiredoxin [Verrucomicrobiales bacterium]|jgi:peroxiredoxin
MESAQKPEVGGPVPEFSLPVIGGGEPESLASILSGRKGALVVFWSAVCSHCRRYDGYLKEFAANHPELGLVVIAARQGETEPELARTKIQRELDFTLLRDANLETARAWLVNQTPCAFLIDAQQLLVYRGAIDNFKYPKDPDFAPYLEDAIADFLAGKAVRRADSPSFGCPTESVYYNK